MSKTSPVPVTVSVNLNSYVIYAKGIMLTPADLKALKTLIDERLDIKLDKKFNEKLKPIYKFIDFAQPVLIAILDESQENFNKKLPERVAKLKAIHPSGHHSS